MGVAFGCLGRAPDERGGLAPGEQQLLDRAWSQIGRRELVGREPTELEVALAALGLGLDERDLEDVVELVVGALVVAVAVLDDCEEAVDACAGTEFFGELTEECDLDVLVPLDMPTGQKPPRRSKRASQQDSTVSIDDRPGNDLRFESRSRSWFYNGAAPMPKTVDAGWPRTATDGVSTIDQARSARPKAMSLGLSPGHGRSGPGGYGSIRPMSVAHWDDVEWHRRAKGAMDASWQRLGDAAGTSGVGVNRVRVAPGKLPTPPHSHGASEELYFVLAGSGLAWQDEQVHEVRRATASSTAPNEHEHTFVAGPEGLEYIVFGTRHATEIGWLPRSRAIRIGWPWVEGATTIPGTRRQRRPQLEHGEPSPRPDNILNVDEVELEDNGTMTTAPLATRERSEQAGSALGAGRARQARLGAALPLRGGRGVRDPRRRGHARALAVAASAKRAARAARTSRSGPAT